MLLCFFPLLVSATSIFVVLWVSPPTVYAADLVVWTRVALWLLLLLPLPGLELAVALSLLWRTTLTLLWHAWSLLRAAVGSVVEWPLLSLHGVGFRSIEGGWKGGWIRCWCAALLLLLSDPFVVFGEFHELRQCKVVSFSNTGNVLRLGSEDFSCLRWWHGLFSGRNSRDPVSQRPRHQTLHPADFRQMTPLHRMVKPTEFEPVWHLPCDLTDKIIPSEPSNSPAS